MALRDWSLDDGRVEYDRSGAAYRGWNEPTYGYRPAYGYGSGEWATQNREAPNFAGRGPKGYRRSDERILEDVCQRLTADAWVDATDVEVTVKGGEVTLSGVVRSRDQRRRSEDLAERISGVVDVYNNLRVTA